MNNDKWISVNVNFPPLGKRYLVSDGINVFEAYRRLSDGQWNGWRTVGDEYFSTITHWQPLPEPPISPSWDNSIDLK